MPKENIIYYYNLLTKEKPTFIETKNSFQRYCLYEALEKYGNNSTIWYQRNKLYMPIYATRHMCRIHNCKLSYYNEKYHNYECDKCEKNNRGNSTDYVSSNCESVAHPNDFLYNSKITVGLNIFYEKPQNIALRQFPKINNPILIPIL